LALRLWVFVMGLQVEEKDVPNGRPHPIDDVSRVEERPLRCVRCGASGVLLFGTQRGDQVCAMGCEE
jgi:hypothetical protein